MPRTALLTLLLLALLPATAQALSVSQADGRLRVTAAAGETNRLQVTALDTGPVIVRDAGAPIEGCPPFGHPDWPGQSWHICAGFPGAPVVRAGDGDDHVTVSDAGTEIPIGATEIDGGPGDDRPSAPYSADTLRGGPGRDHLFGNLGDDHLLGGDGADELDGFFGADRIEGGDGDDTIEGGWDGDTIIAGAGADRVNAAEGEDTVDVRDGAGGDTVLCGADADVVDADAGDSVAADCETVRRPLVEQPGGEEQPGGGERPDGGSERPGGGSGQPGSGRPPGTAQPGTPRPVTTPDRRAPRLALSVRRRRGVTTARARCDEACTVVVRAGTRRVRRTLRAGAAARIRLAGRPRVVRATATDRAGNATRATRRLR
jgi:hypothetical protein